MKKLIKLFPSYFLIKKAKDDFYETDEVNLDKEDLDYIMWSALYGYIIGRFIIVFTILVMLLSLFRCAKPQQIEPIELPAINQPIVVASKYVEIYITYGAVNNFCSVKWSYDPEIDSAYTSNNSLTRTIRNYTNSDSIYISTRSQVANIQQTNTVMVVVDGVIKEQYSGVQIDKKIKLN